MTVAAVFLIIILYMFIPSEEKRGVVVLNGHVFNVEIADTREKRAKGLMHVTDMQDNEGMLFLFEPPQKVNFWNKNVLVPLDVLWIRSGKVTGIYNMMPEKEAGIESIKSPGEIDMVLEIKGGITKTYGIKKGDKAEINIK